jgi:hypothetical protein
MAVRPPTRAMTRITAPNTENFTRLLIVCLSVG